MKRGNKLRLCAVSAVLIALLCSTQPASALRGHLAASAGHRAGSVRWRVAVGDHRVVATAVDRLNVYASTYDGARVLKDVVALRRNNGSERWRVPVVSDGFVELKTAGHVLLVSGRSPTTSIPFISLYDTSSGRLIRRIDRADVCGVAAGVLIAHYTDMRAYELRTGRQLWQVAFDTQQEQCVAAGHLVASTDYPSGIRVFDVRTGRVVLTGRIGLLLALRPRGLLDICSDDQAIGIDVRSGRERWRLAWTCDNDWYPADVPVISTEPLNSVRLADSDTGRLLGETAIADIVPGYGVLRRFVYSFTGRDWLFTGTGDNCTATTQPWGPSLHSGPLPGEELAILNGTILLTQQSPSPTGCQIADVAAFTRRGRLLWTAPFTDASVGYPPVFDQIRLGSATTMAVGSSAGFVTAYAL